VQGQIGNPGAARSAFRESETGFGYRSLRQMILSALARVKTEFGLQPFQNRFYFLPQISRINADENVKIPNLR
jgi:hypothetical protein